MILDTLILENYGAYAGRQEAILTPEPGKPVILFGGMNGGGKTTLLDGIQLALYGAKARLSNRGRLSYRDYLRESIHRAADPGEGAAITLRFRRIMEGETHSFELQRSWRQGAKGIEETLRVLRDGQIDDVYSDHWDEVIEAYLPVRLAHLFFFDGEQIAELAEGGHAADILGTAVHSLLGLDLVDRLDTDLKAFERRKRTESGDPETAARLQQAQAELALIDREQEKVAMEEGGLVNEAGRLAKELHAKEDRFRTEGGELFQRRKELEAQQAELAREKNRTEAALRELVAGPLPLLMVEDLLRQVEEQARHETEIKRARVLGEVLESRDSELLAALEQSVGEPASLQRLADLMAADRRARIGLAEEPLLLDAEDGLAASVAHLRAAVLPAADADARKHIATLAALDEKLVRVETEIARIPEEDRIAPLRAELDAAREAHAAKLAELEANRLRQAALKTQYTAAKARQEKLGQQAVDMRLAEDDRQRMLKHSQRVRDTLARFRVRVLHRHAANMEALMLESFQRLLRKNTLANGLHIDPETFEPRLTGSDAKPLPFVRLSAGERQLLATSMLWGLARASGRPVPAIIDTPLSRLDSSHRRHLVQRYFPTASHQVLLLSTDEEIVGSHLSDLQPYISRSYLLKQDNNTSSTEIITGYFKADETASRDNKDYEARERPINQGAQADRG
jgi:DNA sulfur modification protein DndD